jgi:hypothetical protein
MALAAMAGAACIGQSSRVAADAGIASETSVPPHAQPFDAIPTVSPDLLADLRGGLRVGSLDVDFAANVRTFVNGALVLESTTNLTPGGTTASQPNMPTTSIDSKTLSFVSGLGGGQSNALPANLAGLAGQGGVVVEDPSGVTGVLHNLTREQILGVVFTTASNQQIRQELNVQVTIANFGRFQEAARSALLGGRLLGSLDLTR